MTPEPQVGESLGELHDMLVGKASDLSAAIADAPDSQTVQQIVAEISEVNHRVTLVGNLLFTQDTAAIAKAMARVRDAEGSVDDAIKKLDNATAFLKTMSSFLALVDKVIDTAKLA